MRLFSPYVTLVLILAAAAAILMGGGSLARHEESVRIDRDREPLVEFASDLRLELKQLEQLYADHLQDLAQNAPVGSEVEIRQACKNWYYGVQQFSLLHPPKHKGEELHVAIQPIDSGRLPRPVFTEEKGPKLRSQIRISAEKLFPETGPKLGWIDEPGKPLFFWCQRPAKSGNPPEVVLLLLNLPEIVDRMNSWLHIWAQETFKPIRIAGGPDALQAPGGKLLTSVGVSPELAAKPCNFLLPVRTRFGVWQLATWDRFETRVSYHTPTLVGAATLSVLVALLGAIAFVQHKRTLQLAEQRVSFVNRVSHELRTPLTNILLNADLIADAVEESSPDASRRLALLREEARRLGRLIANVLTFSRKEQGRLRVEASECVPADVIATVLEQFAPSLERRAIQVELQGDAAEPCYLDPDALSQILTNLVSNVEKYAAEGGWLEIRTTQHEGTLQVVVADHGPGIPAHEAERIFKPFHRVHNEANEGVSGTGLGLAIARDLAHRMGGSLRMIPSPKGAAFELSIPVGPRFKKEVPRS